MSTNKDFTVVIDYLVECIDCQKKGQERILYHKNYPGHVQTVHGGIYLARKHVTTQKYFEGEDYKKLEDFRPLYKSKRPNHHKQNDARPYKPT